MNRAVAASGPTEVSLFYVPDQFNTSYQHFDDLIRAKRLVPDLQISSDHSFQYVNKQRSGLSINVLSPAHHIEQPSKLSAKASRASVAEAGVKSTRRHFAFPLTAKL
jgi:hypothetical protein